MDPATLAVIGTGMQLVGQIGANVQQSIAEKANAAFYKKQAEYNAKAMQVNMDNARMEGGARYGAMATVGAASGLDIGTGSMASNLAIQMANNATAVMMAKEAAQLEITKMLAMARQSQSRSETLGSVGYNLLQGGTTALNNYTQWQSISKQNDQRKVNAG